jgi:peroxiredoxin
MRGPGVILAFGTVLLLAGMMFFMFRTLKDLQRISVPRASDVSLTSTGRPAPDFALRTLDGRPLRLSDFRGKVVLVNFWGSWCVPCKEEMPSLQRIWRDFNARGVVVLGVDVQDDPADARAFLRTHQITFPNVYDPSPDRMKAYRVTGVPTTIFVDRQQRIRGRYAGAFLGEPGRAELQRLVTSLLALP